MSRLQRLAAVVVLVTGSLVVVDGCKGDDPTTPPPKLSGEICREDAECLGDFVCCGAPAIIGDDAFKVCVPKSICEADACGEQGECADGLLCCPVGERLEEDQGDIAAARVCAAAGTCDLCQADADCPGFNGIGFGRTDVHCCPDMYGNRCTLESCTEPPMGGAGGTGASSGEGGAGAGGGTGVLLSPHTVLNGTPVTEPSGCLLAAGAGAQPVQLLFDELITGPMELTVEGTMLPIEGGTGIDTLSLVQAHVGCGVNGSALDPCPLFRNDYNIFLMAAGLKIFDTDFSEVASDPWSPQAPAQDFTVVIDADILARTGSISFPNVNATASASNLDFSGGSALALQLSQVRVCRAVVVQ
jgi:hypothetical protein